MGIFDKDGAGGEGGEVVDATERIANKIADDAGDVPELPEQEQEAEEAPADDGGDVEIRVVTGHNGIPKGTQMFVTRDRADALVAAHLAVRVVEGG